MVSQVYRCPFCQERERVVRRGFNRCGTQRLLCRASSRRWTPEGQSRALSKEKQVLIEAALQERTSQRGIARTFKVARTTIRELAKKSGSESCRFWRYAVGGRERRCVGWMEKPYFWAGEKNHMYSAS